MLKNWKTYVTICLATGVLLGCESNSDNKTEETTARTEQAAIDKKKEKEEEAAKLEAQRKEAEVNTRRREKAKRQEERTRKKEVEEANTIHEIATGIEEEHGEFFTVWYNSNPEYSNRRVVELHPTPAEGERLLQSILVLTIASGEENTNTQNHEFNLVTYQSALESFSRRSIDEVDNLEFAIMHPSNPDSAMFIAFEGETLLGYEDFIQAIQGEISE